MGTQKVLEDVVMSTRSIMEHGDVVLEYLASWKEEVCDRRDLRMNDVSDLYKPYLQEIEKQEDKLKEMNNSDLDLKNNLLEKSAEFKELMEEENELQRQISSLENKIKQSKEMGLAKERKLQPKLYIVETCFKALRKLTNVTFAYQTNPVAGFILHNNEPKPFELDATKMKLEEITEFIWKQIGHEENLMKSNKMMKL